MSRNPLAMVLLVAVIVSACKDDPTRFDDSLAGVAITASDVLISDCYVTDNAADGVRVNGSNVRINDCNIERNGGFGANNVGTSRVDARRNWWGDPAGPLGPSGDGVNGDVDYSEHRTIPIPPAVFRVR